MIAEGTWIETDGLATVNSIDPTMADSITTRFLDTRFLDTRFLDSRGKCQPGGIGGKIAPLDPAAGGGSDPE